MTAVHPCLLLVFSDQPGWSDPLGVDVLRGVLSEAGRFCHPVGDPSALWQPVAGTRGVIACELPGWGPQVACEYLRQILQRFDAAEGETGDSAGAPQSPRVLGALACGTVDPEAASEMRVDIERALAWLQSSPLREFSQRYSRRALRVATGDFLAWLRADRGRELMFPAATHTERWQELCDATLRPADETVPPTCRVAVDAADWKTPAADPTAAAARELRVGVVLATTLRGGLEPVPEAVENLPALFTAARIAARIRVEGATSAGLTRLARSGCDLLICCGDCTPAGRFPASPRPVSPADWTTDPALAPLWRGLRGCLVLGAHGERFAQGIPVPWVATSGPDTPTVERLQQLIAPAKGATWAHWVTQAARQELVCHGGGDWATSKIERGDTRLEYGPPQWHGTTLTDLPPTVTSQPPCGRDAVLRLLWRGLSQPFASAHWIHASPGEGVSTVLAEHGRRVSRGALTAATAPTWLLHVDCLSAITSTDLEALLCERVAQLYSGRLPRGVNPQAWASLLPAVATIPGRHVWILDHVQTTAAAGGLPADRSPGNSPARIWLEARRLGWLLQLVVGSRQAAPADFQDVTLAPLPPGDLAELYGQLTGPTSAALPAWTELTHWSQSGMSTATLRGALQWRAWNAADAAPIVPPLDAAVPASSLESLRALPAQTGFDSNRFQQLVWPVVRRAGSFTADELASWLGSELSTAGGTGPGVTPQAWGRGLDHLVSLGWLTQCRLGEAVGYTLPPHQVAAAVRAADARTPLPRQIPLRTPQVAHARLIPLLEKPEPSTLAQLDALADDCRAALDTPGAATTLARMLRWQARWLAQQPGERERVRALNEELVGTLGNRPEAAVLEQVAGAVLEQARSWTEAGDSDRARELLSNVLSRLEGRTEPEITQALATLQAELGAVLVDQGRAAEALPLLERGLALTTTTGTGPVVDGVRRAELARGLALVGVGRGAEGRKALTSWLQESAHDATPPLDEWLAAAHSGLADACTQLQDPAGAVAHHHWVAERLAPRTEPRLVARAAAALRAQARLVGQTQPAEAVSLSTTWLERYGGQSAPALRQLLPGVLLTLAQSAAVTGNHRALDTACGRLVELPPPSDADQAADTAAAVAGWVANLVARDATSRPADWTTPVRDWLRHPETSVTASAPATRFAIAEWLEQQGPATEAVTAWEEVLALPALQPESASPPELARARHGRARALERAGRLPEALAACELVVELAAPQAPTAVLDEVAAALDRQTALLARETSTPAAIHAHHQRVLHRLESVTDPRLAPAIARALYAVGCGGPESPPDRAAHDRLIQRFASIDHPEIRGTVIAALVSRAEETLAQGDASAALSLAERATQLGTNRPGAHASELSCRGWLVIAAACERLGDLAGQSRAVQSLTTCAADVADPTIIAAVGRVQLGLARGLIQSGEPGGALGLLDAVVARSGAMKGPPADELMAWAQLERGRARAALGEVGTAVADLQQAATRWEKLSQPECAEPLAQTLHALVTLLQQQSDLAAEARVREQLVAASGAATDPAVARWGALALVQSAELREKLGQRAEAGELWERVIARHADATDVRLLEPVARAMLARGLSQLRMGNLPAALELAQQVKLRFSGQVNDPTLSDSLRRADGLIQKVEQILQAVQMDSDALPAGDKPAATTPQPVAGAGPESVERPVAETGRPSNSVPVAVAKPAPEPRATAETVPPAQGAPSAGKRPPVKKGGGAKAVTAPAEGVSVTPPAGREDAGARATTDDRSAAVERETGRPVMAGGPALETPSTVGEESAEGVAPGGARVDESGGPQPTAVDSVPPTSVPVVAAASAAGDKPASPLMEETEEFRAYTSQGGTVRPASAREPVQGIESVASPAAGGLTPAEARSLLEDTKLLREAGDRQGALQRYAELIRQFSTDTSPDGLIVLAEAELGAATTRHQAGEWTAARAVCDQVRDRLARQPDAAVAALGLEAQLLKAGFLHTEQQTEEELRVLDEAIALARDRQEPVLAERVARALMSKGSLLGALGNPAGAIGAFDELVTRYRGLSELTVAEQVARALTAKAVRLLQTRDVAGQAVALEEVLRLYGDRQEPAFAGPVAFALFSKALRTSQAGDVPGSLELYGQVIERFRDHSSPEIDEWLAKALFNRGVRLPPAEAISHYDEVVSRFGEHTDPGMGQLCVTALVNKGVTLGQLGRLDEELLAYDAAVRRYGDRREPAIARQAAKALVSKGNSLRRANRQAEAIVAFDELLTRFSGRTEAVLVEQVVRSVVGKAAALGELGNAEQALQLYDSVLQRYGTQTDKAVMAAVAVAVLYKGVSLESVGETAAAQNWLKKHAARLTALPEQSAREWQTLKKKLGF